MVLCCPELEYVNDQGDKVIKRCMPEDEELKGLAESRMMHECRLDRCGTNGSDPENCKKGVFPRLKCSGFKKTASGKIPPPRGEGDKNIVSYDPILLKIYRCHVNLDFAGSAAVVKYLFKYMAKGADTLGMRREHVVDDGTRNTLPRDKIKEFIRGRYISGIQGA